MTDKYKLSDNASTELTKNLSASSNSASVLSTQDFPELSCAGERIPAILIQRATKFSETVDIIAVNGSTFVLDRAKGDKEKRLDFCVGDYIGIMLNAYTLENFIESIINRSTDKVLKYVGV